MNLSSTTPGTSPKIPWEIWEHGGGNRRKSGRRGRGEKGREEESLREQNSRDGRRTETKSKERAIFMREPL